MTVVSFRSRSTYIINGQRFGALGLKRQIHSRRHYQRLSDTIGMYSQKILANVVLFVLFFFPFFSLAHSVLAEEGDRVRSCFSVSWLPHYFGLSRGTSPVKHASRQYSVAGVGGVCFVCCGISLGSLDTYSAGTYMLTCSTNQKTLCEAWQRP